MFSSRASRGVRAMSLWAFRNACSLFIEHYAQLPHYIGFWLRWELMVSPPGKLFHLTLIFARPRPYGRPKTASAKEIGFRKVHRSPVANANRVEAILSTDFPAESVLFVDRRWVYMITICKSLRFRPQRLSTGTPWRQPARVSLIDSRRT